ncbi:MAG: tetratricopeptide repeat protein [Thermoanaerobaculia bacterium]
MPRGLTAHPDEIALLALAIGRDGDAPEGTRGHVGGCPTCARRREELRNLAGAIELEGSLHEEIENAVPQPPSPDARGRSERLAQLAEGAETAVRDAHTLTELARDAQADLAGEVRALAGCSGGRLVLLYAAQRGALAAAAPLRALALAEAIQASVDGPAPPTWAAGRDVPTELIHAEARLLASQALLNIGRLVEARVAAVDARIQFARIGHDPFNLALCDYFEASVLCFQGEFGHAERLFKAAARVFADFAQDHWVGRAEAMLAQMLVQRGNLARAIATFDAAIERLDPEHDASSFTAGLLNRSRCLALLGRFSAAQQGYAQALQVARRHRLDGLIFGVRQGLADLEFQRGAYEKALSAFEAVAAEADRLGFEEDQVVARLCAAECLGRLGRPGEMIRALREVGRRVAVTDLAGNPAWGELAARLDPGDVDLGLVSRVREHLAAARDGFVLPFRSAKQA